jgi:hypothetical protein
MRETYLWSDISNAEEVPPAAYVVPNVTGDPDDPSKSAGAVDARKVVT